jgi:transposase InsO family protein
MRGVLREEPVVKYAAIAAHVRLFPVAFMCRELDIAPSGYYAWLANAPSKRSVRDGVLLVHVRAAFKTSRRRYGSPRVHADLQAAGHRVARKRVARLMRQDGLRARHRRRFVHTTQSRHKYPISRNVVAREFDVSAPNQVWVSDLTYLRTQTGFVYLAVILDLFARRVVGWSVSRNLDAGIAVEALRRALALRPAPTGMVHHSDRGIHYACTEYRALLASHGITPSMSRKGNCWDNAVAESFFSSFGFELEFDANWHDEHDVERDATEYIDGFYNPRRRHSHNSYLSPIDFEHQFMQQENAS